MVKSAAAALYKQAWSVDQAERRSQTNFSALDGMMNLAPNLQGGRCWAHFAALQQRTNSVPGRMNDG